MPGTTRGTRWGRDGVLVAHGPMCLDGSNHHGAAQSYNLPKFLDKEGGGRDSSTPLAFQGMPAQAEGCAQKRIQGPTMYLGGGLLRGAHRVVCTQCGSESHRSHPVPLKSPPRRAGNITLPFWDLLPGRSIPLFNTHPVCSRCRNSTWVSGSLKGYSGRPALVYVGFPRRLLVKNVSWVRLKLMELPLGPGALGRQGSGSGPS